MKLLDIIRLFWLLIAILTLGAANAVDKKSDSPEITWHEYKSVNGYYSIKFPTNPVSRTTHQKSVIGQITNHVMESKSAIGRFSVDYSELPGFAVAFTGDDTIYSHAIGGLLKKTLGKIETKKDIKLQGHSGKSLIYTIPQAPGKVQFSGLAYIFLIDKHLYIINAISPSTTSALQGNFFLNSLRFY